MRQISILIFILFSQSILAETTLYQDISNAMKSMSDKFEQIEMQQGLDFNSKETFKNSKGKVEPITHMYVEGPLKDDRVSTLEKGINFTAQLIFKEVDANYKTENMIYPGLGVAVVDLNGTNVGILDYKVSHEPNTYGKRAVVVTEKGLYSYSISMHKSEPKDKAGLHLMTLLIASVNSGKL